MNLQAVFPNSYLAKNVEHMHPMLIVLIKRENVTLLAVSRTTGD